MHPWLVVFEGDVSDQRECLGLLPDREVSIVLDVPVKVAATGFALVDPINICLLVSAKDAIFLLASRYIVDETVLADKVRSLDKVRELKPGLDAAAISSNVDKVIVPEPFDTLI